LQIKLKNLAGLNFVYKIAQGKNKTENGNKDDGVAYPVIHV
jgi:hypothetical protein